MPAGMHGSEYCLQETSYETIQIERLVVNETIVFEFGDKNLWIDKIAGISQAEIWLEIQTDDIQKANDYFSEKGIPQRDEIEPLPPKFNGFWISSPSNIIHLIHQQNVNRFIDDDAPEQ